jgi:hypothetical protein
MASPVTKIIALPIPCKTRNPISARVNGAMADKRDAIVKIIIPEVKTFFIPYISAILPKGTANMADVNKNAVGIQLSKIASAANSEAIAGSAMLTEEPINGVKKEAIVAINRADILLTLLPMKTPIKHIYR